MAGERIAVLAFKAVNIVLPAHGGCGPCDRER